MALAHDPTTAPLDPSRPLLIVDVDEVLCLFMHGFGRFVADRGYDLRVDRFALFQNLYPVGGTAPVDMATGKRLFDDFFTHGVEHVEPAPHAVESLRGLAEDVSVVVLTNAPGHARPGRARWLTRHGIDYPMIINEGPKGAAVAALSARTRRKAAFVDDLLYNLDSVEQAAPLVLRFQHVADERLRPLAPAAPDRHTRIDHWPTLAAAISAALRDAPE